MSKKFEEHLMKFNITKDKLKMEIEKVQLSIDKRDNNQLRTMELLGKREGLELALEIISNPK